LKERVEHMFRPPEFRTKPIPENRMKRAVTLLALVAIAACSDTSQDALGPTTEALTTAPLQARAAPNDWIVVFRPGVADAPGLARQLVANAGGSLRFTYEHTIQGFAATLPDEALNGIRNNPNVDRIEPDLTVEMVDVQQNATWGLDRIDQASGLSGTYEYNADGSGVTAYILDTGIRETHTEFGGRASRSAESDFIGDGQNGYDCQGHGTHVAGTVGGSTYGVAKAVDLVAVRVLGCSGSGSWSGVIAGVDWVTSRHINSGGPSVANMSLSGGNSGGLFTSLDDAVEASSNAGVVYAVAAGNASADACNSTPASEETALTVGASTSTDSRSSFSNWGTCVDLFAPGSAITSATKTSDTSTGTWNGTSMASPHVAGVAALVLDDNPAASSADVRAAILGNTTDGVLSNVGSGSPNKLLYSLFAAVGPPGAPPSAPADLRADAMSPTRIDLTWTNTSSEQDEVYIERSTSGGPFSRIATVGGGATSFSDGSVAPSTGYAYQVKGKNAVGEGAYSNVASATTEAEPPPPADVVAAIFSVSSVTNTHQGKFTFGEVGIAVAESGWDPETELLPNMLAGVTVTGDWYETGATSPIRSSSGVTDGSGVVILLSGRTNTRSDLHFCVTSLSGEGYVDGGSHPTCSPDFKLGDPGDDPGGDPPTPVAPSDLTATWTQKGGGRVELAWTSGGGSSVDIWRGSQRIATTSDSGKYNDRSGSVGDGYRVCIAGSDAEADCTTATATGPTN
jgi:subtilisin family serine protease